MIKPGDLIQITREDHHWFPCVAMVSEVKSFGCQAFVWVPAGGGVGEVYIRLKREDYEKVGEGIVVPGHVLEED